jgi:hypothetical protein
VPPLCEFCPGICLTTEEEARKNLSRLKKTSVRLRKTSVIIQYTYYHNTHTLQNSHKHTQCLAYLFTVIMLDGLPVFTDKSSCAIAGHLGILRRVKSQKNTDLRGQVVIETLNIAVTKDTKERWIRASSGVPYDCCFASWLYRRQMGPACPDFFSPFRPLVYGRPYDGIMCNSNSLVFI